MPSTHRNDSFFHAHTDIIQSYCIACLKSAYNSGVLAVEVTERWRQSSLSLPRSLCFAGVITCADASPQTHTQLTSADVNSSTNKTVVFH